MKRIFLLAACVAVFCAGAFAIENDALVCRECAALYGEDKAGTIKYAPDRKIDIEHLALDVTPDFEKRTVRGEVTFTFKPVAKPLEELRLDGVDLTVSEVLSDAKIAAHENTGKEIVVTFAEPVAVGRETKLTIRYSAQPRQGLYFRVASNGYRADEPHVWSQGESVEARHWFPCYDYPNAKFTTEVTCRVPEGMRVLSNGRQVASQKDANGLLAVTWKQDKPMSNYLLALDAGRFEKIEDQYRDIPLAFYAPPSDIKYAPLTFAETKPAMEFFENEIGAPFPWAQYGQVVVRDFTWGGMENTTLTTLTEFTLHTPETENIYTSEGLVAHELAHQWFGDLVTCKDWSHTWLNEGFATYYAALFAGHRHGRDELLYEMHGMAQSIINNTAKPHPTVWRGYDKPYDQFDGIRIYSKGAWVLHMLRAQLGEDLYRRCIKTYLERHPFGNVVTDDLRAVVEELSARSFDEFFDQWLYHAHFPELDVKYSWDEKTKLAKVSVKQTQKTSAEVPVFRFPLALRFKNKNGEAVTRRVDVKSATEDFYVPLKSAPEIVRIDPDGELLAKIVFKPSGEMLRAQLADKTDMLGRIIATEELAEKDDDATIASLKNALQNDAFYGVRLKASIALKKIHSDEALDALIASLKQPDARVRNGVVGDIAGFFHPRAFEALRKVLDEEKNPAILATAIRGLGPYHRDGVRDVLVKFLRSESFREQLAEAAIAAMKAQDDPRFIAPLREELAKRGESAFSSRDFGRGMDALAYLDRNEKPRDEVREFLAGFLNSKRENTQLNAMKALGVLEDPKAISLLEKFEVMPKETPQHQEAQKAIEALRAANKPNDNLKDLRKEVLDLQKANRDLRKDFEDFKKRIEARETKAAEKKNGK